MHQPTNQPAMFTENEVWGDSWAHALIYAVSPEGLKGFFYRFGFRNFFISVHDVDLFPIKLIS